MRLKQLVEQTNLSLKQKITLVKKLQKEVLAKLSPERKLYWEGLIAFLPIKNLQNLLTMNEEEMEAELSRILPLAKEHQGLSTCDDCGSVMWYNEKDHVGNSYMLKDDLWNKYVGKYSKIICPVCLEKRMKRQLTKDDLKPDVPLNRDFSYRALNK